MTATNYEVEQVLQDFVDRRAKGQSPSVAEYVERHPHIAEKLREKFAILELLNRSVLEGGGGPLPAERILGDYHLRRELGRGGMGVVFLAEQVSENRLVALKLLSSAPGQRYDTIERFRREAEIASRLRHPNLVSVYATGERHGYVFYAMQYVEGVTLDKLLARLRELGADQLETVDLGRVAASLFAPDHSPASDEEKDSPDAESEPKVSSSGGSQRALGYYGVVARLVSELADGLAYAHSRGIIHRDVKPANILLSEDLVPQLADFGVARDVDQKTLSQTGEVVGTPHYMSPELALAGRLPIDHRTDIYSLGVTLFEMLTLALPFRGATAAEVLQKIALEPTPIPTRINPGVPADLQTIALKALEKDPGHRYATASEMAEDLRRVLRFDRIKARMPGKATLLARLLRRNWRLATVFAIIAVLLAALPFVAYRTAETRAFRDQISAADYWERTASGPELARLNTALDILTRVDAESGGRFPEVRESITRVEKRLETEIDQRMDKSEEKLARPNVSESERLDAISSLEAALSIARADQRPRIQERLDDAKGILPVDIFSEPTGANVVVHRVSSDDARIGAGRNCEITPLTGLRLQIGENWIVVEKPGVGFGEYLLNLERPRSTDDSGASTPRPTGATPAARLAVTLRPTKDVTSNMALVPAGEYKIGLDTGKLGRPRLDEFEEAVVTVPAFYIDLTEVSNEEYAVFVRATGHRMPPAWLRMGDTFKPGTERLPVTNVSWDDARLYAEWAGKRLPTELEWEVACRGPESRLYPWGNEFDAANATVPITLHDRIGFDPEKKLKPVDSLPEGKSPFGLFHMADNASEWVWDRWNGAVRGTLGADSIKPRGQRVIRGEWIELPEGPRCLPTIRSALSPEFFATHIGFRCAKSVRP